MTPRKSWVLPADNSHAFAVIFAVTRLLSRWFPAVIAVISESRNCPTGTGAASAVAYTTSMRFCQFNLAATRAYAWSSPIKSSTKRRFYAVLHQPPVDSPLTAV